MKRAIPLFNSPIFRAFSSKASGETVKIKFLNTKDDTEKEVYAKIGDHLLEVAHSNEIDLEGACEASLACSTCHVILEDKIYDGLDYP